MIDVCSFCKKSAEIAREDRVVEYDLDDQGKAVSAETVKHLLICQECI